MSRPAGGLGLQSRLYAALLWFYPRSLRVPFGTEMQAIFVDQLIDARGKRGWRGAVDVWLRVAGETAETLAVSYFQALGVSLVSAFASLFIMCVMLVALSG